MFKKFLVALMVCAFIAGAVSYSIAQEDEGKIVSGTVEEVSSDGSFVVINGQKLMIDPELKEYMNMEAGDEVELMLENTDQGQMVVDFDYI